MAAKKQPGFKLNTEAHFEFTGRGTVTWFSVKEADDFDKIGGNLFPENPDKIEQVIADVIAEAQAECDEAGIKVTQVSPTKKDDEGRLYYKMTRKEFKADGSRAVIKFRNINGKPMEEPDEELGNGSLVNIKYMAKAYYMPASNPTPDVTIPARIGCSFTPLEIQVIDHKVYEGGDGGFDDESDGSDFSDESGSGSEDY